MPLLGNLGLTVQPYTALYTKQVADSDITVSQSQTEGRNAIVLDFKGGAGVFSRDLGTIFSWDTALNNLILDVWQPSIIDEPEGIYGRATDWDDAGNPGAKFIQGVIVEGFSFGNAKTFFLQDSDTLTLHPLNECPATFAVHTEIAFSCVPFVAHSARLISSDGVEWKIWSTRLVFQPWPEQCENWQTELTSLGMTGWAHAREMNVPYVSTRPVVLTLTFDAWPTIVLVLPSTNGAQAKTKVTLPANKWKLMGLQANSTAVFRLFAADMELKVRQWGSSGQYQVLKPFGGKSRTGAAV